MACGDTILFMEIQNQITQKDLVDFNLYHLAHSPIIKRRRLRCFLSGVVWSILWIVFALFSGSVETAKALMPLILSGPLFMVMLLVAWRRSVPRLIQKQLAEGTNKGLFMPYRVILLAEGIENISQLSRSFTHWKAVEKICVTQESLYVYVNAVSALIVPKRSFPNDAAFEEFVKTTKEYYAQSTN